MAVQRNRIPIEVRKRLVRAYEDPTEDSLTVADTLGVNRSTARGILTRHIREGGVQERPRDGRNNVKVDDDIKKCLNDLVDDNCMLTLTEINRELKARANARNNTQHCCLLLRDVSRCVLTLATSHNMWGF